MQVDNVDDVIIPDEQRLYETLMDGYEKSVRPVINSSTIVMVKFGLHLNQIIGLVSTFILHKSIVLNIKPYGNQTYFYEI